MGAELPPLGDVEFRGLQRLVYELTGITVPDSKRLMLQSRLAPRLRARQCADFATYWLRLATPQGKREETQSLINAVTTNKTSFFREPHQFTALSKEWAPGVIERARRGARKKLRLWSAACSTGAEPWSLAMMLSEAIGDLTTWDVKILASDIDTDVLSRAHAGVYEAHELEGLDPARRERHLRSAGNGKFAIVDALRRLVVFKRINFRDAIWPIQTTFDVVLCRNASIYFDPQTQRRLFERLSSLLDPGGWLLVGHAEVLHGFENTLEARPGGLYRRRAGSASPAPRSSAPTPHASFSAPGAFTEQLITVGELHAANEPTEIRTLLGSCVAACLFDPVARIGGMNHFLLPQVAAGELASTRFGVHAMETLINSMMHLGADPRRLVARLYGGANVITGVCTKPTIGERNATFALAFLEREGIPLVASVLGGKCGLEVRFESNTGRATTREIGREQIDTAKEGAAASLSIGGEVELFIDD
jgi:chemotaxis protein methyltransferase CheR